MALSRRSVLFSFSVLAAGAAAGYSPGKAGKGQGTQTVLTATTGYPEPHTLSAPGGEPGLTGSKVLERLLRYSDVIKLAFLAPYGRADRSRSSAR